MKTLIRTAMILLAVLIPWEARAQVDPTGSISTADTDCSPSTSCVGWSTVGLESFGVYINVATSGTFVYEVSQDATLLTNGTWVGINDSAGAASATADGAYYFANSGFLMFRVRASAISGTATVSQARGYGGSAGGGSAGGGTSNTTEATQLLVLGAVDGLETLVGNINTTVYTDGGVFTEDTNKGLAVFGVYRGTPAAVTDGDLTPFITDSSGRIIESNSASEHSSGANAKKALLVDATGTAVDFVTDPLHSEAVADWTAQGGIVQLCQASATAPTAVSAQDAVACWAGLNGETIVAGSAIEDVAATAGGYLFPMGAVVRTPGTGSTATDAENATINVDSTGLLLTRGLDPCSGVAKQFFAWDITTGATTEITPSLSGSGNYWYICAINAVTTAANNVNLVDDNTDGCGSVTASLVSSGLTAGDGWGFGANGGIAQGSGSGTIMRSVTTNSVLCMVTSAATEFHGQIVAVAAP